MMKTLFQLSAVLIGLLISSPSHAELITVEWDSSPFCSYTVEWIFTPSGGSKVQEHSTGTILGGKYVIDCPDEKGIICITIHQYDRMTKEATDEQIHCYMMSE